MGLIDSIASGGVSGILTGAGQFAKDIRQAITGEISAEKKAEIEQKALELEIAAAQGQLDVNLEEAKHPNVFVAGWRPFIGWVCGGAIAWHYVGNPLAYWIGQALGKTVVIPALDAGELTTILFAMLGLGGMRMAEKMKGTQGNH